MVSHAGESCGLGKRAGRLPAGCGLGRLFGLSQRGGRQRPDAGDKQAKARFGETFAERALSSRAGERVKQSNKRYCTERMPDPGRLKAHLQAQFDANKVDSISDMYDILAVELSCYRSPPGAGTPSDVTLNYNHLYYFWMTQKKGSVTQAAEALFLTPRPSPAR